MSSNPSRLGASGSVAEERDGLPLAAFCFVIVALIALAATPAVLLQRISEAIREITTTVLPAYKSARNLEFAMEERIATSRSRFLTGDTIYSLRLAEARTAEAAALHEIEKLAPDLGGAIPEHMSALQKLMARRDSLEAAMLVTGNSREAFLASVHRFDLLRDSMVVQLNAINQDLVRITTAQVTEEARLARLQREFSFILGAVALLAALLVGWFAWRQRNLRRQVQRALEEANRQRALAERRQEELESATEARRRLLRGVTHDVKNPLGAAKGYADLLQMEVKAPLLPEQRPYVEGIQRSVDGALSIIADLLDLARADSGGLSVERAEFDLADVVLAVVSDHRPSAQSAGHSIELRPPTEPLCVFSDPSRVTQVLGNLLSNAIKYTPPPGRITVQFGVEAANGGGTWATVQVSDTGPGIPTEQKSAIFDEFTRLEDRGAQKGHGLGLAIARRIARLLDGDLTVEDAPTGGATFILWLPLREGDTAPMQAEQR